jgi:hypothetical protein
MYADEIYTVGEMFLLCLMTGTIGYLMAARRYEKKIERERAIRDRYKWQLGGRK